MNAQDTLKYEYLIFYKYTPIRDPQALALWLRGVTAGLSITGRIIVAHEGINGCIEGLPTDMVRFKSTIATQVGGPGSFGKLHDIWYKSSQTAGGSFPRMRVRVRNEIVSTGLSNEEQIDPNNVTGTHLSAEELNDWIQKGEDFEIIDMRNNYEFKVGHFKGSRNPGMENFRDMAKTVAQYGDFKKKKIVTVCTYGVRCEKASGYLKRNGYEDVYQLHGGIGSYMAQFPGKDFLGSLYVFDDRITERFTDHYEIVGRCERCAQPNEQFINCAWGQCHKKMLVCPTCISDVSNTFCSPVCMEKMRAVV
jgi:UPF0176 protein